MPTYDYRCEACGKKLEVFQSITDSPKRKCPKCGRAKLKRQIGAGAGIIFKGSGFYQTDYRSDSYKKGADSDKPASEPAKDDAKPKSEAKKKKKEKTGGD